MNASPNFILFLLLKDYNTTCFIKHSAAVLHCQQFGGRVMELPSDFIIFREYIKLLPGTGRIKNACRTFICTFYFYS